jgi:hypothetical protein
MEPLLCRMILKIFSSLDVASLLSNIRFFSKNSTRDYTMNSLIQLMHQNSWPRRQ